MSRVTGIALIVVGVLFSVLVVGGAGFHIKKGIPGAKPAIRHPLGMQPGSPVIVDNAIRLPAGSQPNLITAASR